jgi:hypothetical protein
MAISSEDTNTIAMSNPRPEQSFGNEFTPLSKLTERQSNVLPCGDDMGVSPVILSTLVDELADGYVPERRLFGTVEQARLGTHLEVQELK